jgi:hypothetical protein
MVWQSQRYKTENSIFRKKLLHFAETLEDEKDRKKI